MRLSMPDCAGFALALALLMLASGGCGSSGADDLQGHWTGRIMCLGDTSDLSLGLQVDQDKIRGNGQIRTQGSNADYSVTGTQSTVDRLTECVSTPTCSGNPDCAALLDQNSQTGNSRCLEGLCSLCFEHKQQRQVVITMRHENPSIPYPQLELWRLQDKLMEGTVRKFCADEDRQIPKVTVNKQ